jgi:hypothetical protein
MAEGSFLILQSRRKRKADSIEHVNHYVQFSVGHGTIYAEAASNAYSTSPEEVLSPDDHATLGQLGWNSPTTDQTVGGWADGMPTANFFIEFVNPDFRRIAELAVRTLRRVYVIHDTAQLQYLSDLDFPDLRLHHE